MVMARISGLDPSSAMIAPMYLKLLTQSSSSPLALVSVLMPLVLLVISLFFSATNVGSRKAPCLGNVHAGPEAPLYHDAAYTRRQIEYVNNSNRK